MFKRDGFRCRYCGATPDQVVLHVDHVVPVAEDGTDDPQNLITACAGCNLGKSDRPIDARALPLPTDPEQLREQIEQIREYLDLQKQLTASKEQVYAHACSIWEERIGPLSQDMANRMRVVLARDPLVLVIQAIDIVASRFGDPDADYDWPTALQQQRYFYGCLRNLREGNGS
ncbi:MAG: HNH endonuclease signature motif containing protein [Planctomycetota bacterium]